MTSCDLNVLQATVAEGGLMSEYTRVHTTTPQNSAAPREQQQQKPSERSCSGGAKVQLPADSKKGPNSGVRHILTYTQT